jgi:CBS domain-containing protein
MSARLSPVASTRNDMSVGDAMRPGVVTCLADDRLAKLAAIIVHHGIHALILASTDGGAPLVLTDLDVVRAALDQPDVCAAAIAREPAASIESDAPLEPAIVTMAEQYVAHLLVTDPRSGAATGVISSFDIAAVVGGYQPRLARLLRPGPARPSLSARTLGEAVVRDAMHAGVTACPADVTLATVARSMAEHRVHCIAVTGIERPGQHLTWGLIGAMDLVLAAHRGALDEPAARIAATEPIAVQEDDSLDHAAALMVEHDTSHVVVVGPSGLPAGIVSTRDIATVLGAGA